MNSGISERDASVKSYPFRREASLLHYRTAGQGRPVVIVHGLFGSGDNWATLATKFPGYQVVLPDLRNHGDSPWLDTFSHADLAADLLALHRSLGLPPCPWLGHSLGGKAVMELALSAPEAVTGIVALDILPKATEARYPGFVAALRSLDLNALASRSDAQARLEAAIPDKATLQFLLKSLVPNGSGGWRWKLNLATLEREYAQIWKPIAAERTYDGPALFLYGGASDYYQPGDEELASSLFPLAQFEVIAGAGHWLHAEKPAEVLTSLNRWLSTLE